MINTTLPFTSNRFGDVSIFTNHSSARTAPAMYAYCVQPQQSHVIGVQSAAARTAGGPLLWTPPRLQKHSPTPALAARHGNSVMSKASQSASAPSHVRFSALDVDAESGHAQPSAPPSRWFDPVFLRKVVLAQALFCCVVLIPLAVAVALGRWIHPGPLPTPSKSTPSWPHWKTCKKLQTPIMAHGALRRSPAVRGGAGLTGGLAEKSVFRYNNSNATAIPRVVYEPL